jgi:hypothetical protein
MGWSTDLPPVVRRNCATACIGQREVKECAAKLRGVDGRASYRVPSAMPLQQYGQYALWSAVQRYAVQYTLHVKDGMDRSRGR